MEPHEFYNRLTMTSMMFQAVCRQDGFKAPLRNEQMKAYEDARDYRSIPGNEDKIIEVIGIQSYSVSGFD